MMMVLGMGENTKARMLKYWLLIIGMIAGLGLGLMACSPKVIEVPAPFKVIEYQTVNVTQPVFIDRPVLEIVTVNVTTIKEVEVEKIVYESRTDWRFFETLPEFTAWMEGKLVLLMPPADCDDYAQYLQVAAYKDGYILSAQLVDKDGYLFGKKVIDGTGAHDMIRVNIGNEIFVVEPQPDKFRIIKVGNRD